MKLTPVKTIIVPPAQDWTDLEPNTKVQVLNTDGTSYAAVVDDISDDSTVMWIRRQDDWSRHLFEQLDGIRIIPHV